jgi:hypothetical protein
MTTIHPHNRSQASARVPAQGQDDASNPKFSSFTVWNPEGTQDRGSLADCRSLKCKLLLAYERLAGPHAQPGFSGGETIAQFGDFDVHLVQSTHEPSFWIEVYSHSSASTLECYGFDQLDDDELARIIDFIAPMRRQFPRS